MGNRILYLVRNGQYERDDPDGGTLTEIGRKQAMLTARALRDLHISAVYYSPHQQVTETAQIIIQAFVRVHTERTRLLRQYETYSNEEDTLHPDIIRRMVVSQRKHLESAYDHFFIPTEEDETRREVLVCHANIIRDLICRALGVKPETWAHMLINHCGISTVSINPTGDKELLVYNNVHHLPDALRTDA